VKKFRIAIPTQAYAGLEDAVSEVFGKAKTFTIVDVEGNKVANVQVIDNPAASYDYGSGPIASKTLADLKVDFVMTAELGPGASGLLQKHNVRKLPAEPGAKVADSLNDALKTLASDKATQA
jgi:predicted Fe-Mo cluster-binding NifX family protein